MRQKSITEEMNIPSLKNIFKHSINLNRFVRGEDSPALETLLRAIDIIAANLEDTENATDNTQATYQLNMLVDFSLIGTLSPQHQNQVAAQYIAAHQAELVEYGVIEIPSWGIFSFFICLYNLISCVPNGATASCRSLCPT